MPVNYRETAAKGAHTQDDDDRTEPTPSETNLRLQRSLGGLFHYSGKNIAITGSTVSVKEAKPGDFPLIPNFSCHDVPCLRGLADDIIKQIDRALTLSRC